MRINVLVVDKDMDPALRVINLLGDGFAQVAFVNKAEQAINNLRKHKYHLIILGDTLLSGDTYDVGVELQTKGKNRGIPVICVGEHPSRTTKLVGMLVPYATRVNVNDERDLALCASLIKERFAA